MSKNRDRESLIDIYNAATEVIDFTKNIDKDRLKTDTMRRNAVLYSIQIIGEATKRLSPEFRAINSHIPWKQMAGIRDKIVHDYDGVDFDLVWFVAKKGVPKLVEDVKFLIEKSSSSKKNTLKNKKVSEQQEQE